MNDDRLLLEMRRWLQEERVVLPDAEEAGQRIASRLPTTMQRRRRRWRLPALVRTLKPASTRDTTDYQPKPTPATNGHSPTVIGRTQTMFSPAKAIVAGALVFGIGGVLLIAQPFEPQGSALPGATTDSAIDPCATPIVYVTGHVIWGREEPGTKHFSSGGSQRIRGQVYVNTMDLDDDRLDGPGTTSLDWDITGGGSSNDTIRRGSIHIENEAGAWEGPFTGIGQYQALRNALSLTGSGAYEGLSATLLHVSNDDVGGVIEGAIYPTDIASCDSSER
jgi:hypothetical protein